jgi:Domain of unknown function (DUF4136)
MITFRTLLILGLLAAFGGAARAQTVTSTYDKDYGLSRLRTYEYKVEEREKSDPLATDTLMEKKLKDALDDELENHGYHPAAGGATPDFLVAFHVQTKDKTYELGGERNFVQGILIVDFHDAETKRLVWRGVATGVVGAQAVDLRLAEEKLKEAARLLLEQFGRDLPGY